MKLSWNNRAFKTYLFSAVAATAILWTIFKLLYPYPNLIFDSYNYVKAAALNWDFNAWPIGYSKFLQIFSYFSHSANLLVCLQYILVEGACLVFFFTWLSLFDPGKLVCWILFAILFCNPLLLYCCNYLISDPLFICLSILWLSQLLWIVYRPNTWMIFMNAGLLALAFTVRYNALYYPFVAALAFGLSRQRSWFKLAGIILPIALVAGFVSYTSNKVERLTGRKQFSAFGSWKLANNALYAYAHVIGSKQEPLPQECLSLDSTVRYYFARSTLRVDMFTSDFSSGSYFMYGLNTPLVEYMQTHYYSKEWPLFLNSKKYWKVAPLYQSYALYLIRKYPNAFLKYFIWPNFLRYWIPPVEIFGSVEHFSIHESFGGVYLRQLFDLSTIDTPHFYIIFRKEVLKVFPLLMAVIHLGFLFGLVMFALYRGFQNLGRPLNYCIVLVAMLWGCDFCFSVISAGIVMRYEIFMMVQETAFGLYFIEYVHRRLSVNGKSPARPAEGTSQIPTNSF